MKQYNAYVLHGYEKQNSEGHFLDNVEMEIIANSEKEALEKAEKYIKKPEYKIDSIVDVEQLSDEKMTVFMFQAYEEIEDGRFTNFCVIEAIAENSDEAEKKARSLMTKKNYRLWKIIEKYARS